MRYMVLLVPLALSACSNPEFQALFGPPQSSLDPVEAAAAAAIPDEPVETLDPTPPPPPPPEANTAEEFDTTTEEDRAEALDVVEEAGETELGTTLATLGNPAIPGIWLETPFVSEVTPGRVEAASGESINIELRPSGGQPGSGSEISLPAMQLLNLPLTAIEELTVFRL